MFFFHLGCAIADSARDISVSDKRRGREEHRVSAQAALMRFVTPPATFIARAHVPNAPNKPADIQKNLRVSCYLEDLRVYLEMSLALSHNGGVLVQTPPAQ